MLAVRRRRRIAALLPFVLAGGLASFGATGCDVDPFCVDCPESDGGEPVPDTGTPDARPFDAEGTDGGEDAGPVDGGPDAGCVEGTRDDCNDRDDDCDGRIDEDADPMNDVDNCGGCGMVCAPDHALGSCEMGTCHIGSCALGFYDLDGDESNGCEYGRCLPVELDDRICDRRDDDCDGTLDEDGDCTSDPLNCGSCGTSCRFPHAMGDCTASACVLGACAPGFVDDDGVADNGCEYACTPAMPPDDVCNARDDDCDGDVDEGDPGDGIACGESEGECRTGTLECRGGTLVCDGAVEPDVETCDGLDNDCDGTADEGNPEGGRVCGISTSRTAASCAATNRQPKAGPLRSNHCAKWRECASRKAAQAGRRWTATSPISGKPTA